MSVDLERQIQAYAASVLDRSEPAVLHEASGDGTAQPVRQPRGPLVAALTFGLVVLIGVVAWLLVQRPDEVIDAPTTTIPTATTVATTTTSAAGTAQPPFVTGLAEDAGWTWLPLDDRIGAPALGGRSNVLGTLADGTLVAFLGDGMNSPINCNGCSLLLASRGDWREVSLEPFGGASFLDMTVRGGLLWAWTGNGGPISLSVSPDGVTWSVVVFDSLAEAPHPDGPVRFLRLDDSVLAIVDFSPTRLFVSSDEGRNFEEMSDLGNEQSGSSTSDVAQAWVADGWFYIVTGASRGQRTTGSFLVRSQDGTDWEQVGEVSGLPTYDHGAANYTPEPYVITSPDAALMTISLISTLEVFLSEDGGLTWEPVGEPPFGQAAGASVIGGWLRVIDTETEEWWVTRNGMSWFSFKGGLSGDWGNMTSGVLGRRTASGHEVAIPPSP